MHKIGIHNLLFIIAIAGHPGAGKSTVLRIDDYQALSFYPPTAKWLDEGSDPNQFQIVFH